MKNMRKIADADLLFDCDVNIVYIFYNITTIRKYAMKETQRDRLGEWLAMHRKIQQELGKGKGVHD